MKWVFTLFMIFLLHIGSQSQMFVGISVSGIAFHPQKSENAGIYKWRLDKKGKLVGFASISVVATYHINKFIGIKAVQSIILHDCAGQFAGLSHIGIDFHDDIIGWENPNHQWSFSFGPLFYYRKGWHNNKKYRQTPNFLKLSKNRQWESKFVWYGGQIQYDYRFEHGGTFNLNFLPGFPYLYTFGIGGSVGSMGNIERR